MRKTRSNDRDQRAKYGTASVSSFNHGWRNYRFIFSIIFIFTTSPFALLRLRLRRFGVSLLFSPSSFLRLPVPSHSLHSVPRTMSLIFSSPFLTLLFFRDPRFTSFFVLSAFLFLFDAVSSPLLPPSVSPSSSPLHSAPDPSSSDSLPHRGSFLLLSHTGNTRVRRPPRAGLDSTFRIVIEREHDR